MSFLLNAFKSIFSTSEKEPIITANTRTQSLLDLDDDILLLEEYQIRTFPDYIILRKGGKIGMAPAPAPDQYLDYHVRRIYKYL